jgi:hypothetical protein
MMAMPASRSEPNSPLSLAGQLENQGQTADHQDGVERPERGRFGDMEGKPRQKMREEPQKGESGDQ